MSVVMCVLRSPSRDGWFPKEKERSGRAFRERVQRGTLQMQLPLGIKRQR